MDKLTGFAHALSDATRWRILRLVRDEALCVCELADILQMPQSSVSSHLQVIRRTGLLANERCEKWVYYRVRPEYREMIVVLGERFEATEATSRTLAGDARRAQKRLAQRTKSCCPGPKELVGEPAGAGTGRGH